MGEPQIRVLQAGFGAFGPVHLEAWLRLGIGERLWLADPGRPKIGRRKWNAAKALSCHRRWFLFLAGATGGNVGAQTAGADVCPCGAPDRAIPLADWSEPAVECIVRSGNTRLRAEAVGGLLLLANGVAGVCLYTDASGRSVAHSSDLSSNQADACAADIIAYARALADWRRAHELPPIINAGCDLQ